MSQNGKIFRTALYKTVFSVYNILYLCASGCGSVYTASAPKGTVMKKNLSFILLFRGILTVAKPILWYAFFAEVILQYVVFGKYRADVRNPLMYAAAAAILSIPFLAGWIQSAFSCRSFSGTIEEIKVRHRLQTNATGARFHRSNIIVTDHLYVIRTAKGRRIRFLIREPNFEYSRYFSRGTEVRHPFGARFFDRAVPSGDDRLCVVCGREKTVCTECRSPLL